MACGLTRWRPFFSNTYRKLPFGIRTLASASIVPTNLLKKKLTEQGTAVGTFLVEFHQPAVIQLMVNSGFETIVIDSEHGPYTIERIAVLARSARLQGITPLLRVCDYTYPHIAQPLDAGVQGLIIPRISTPEEVQQVVSYSKYAPDGVRGSALVRGYTDFKGGDIEQTANQANKESMLIFQIETAGAISNLDKILSVKGVDAALIGPNDLSIALGIPGQFTHPTFEKTMRNIIDACRRHKVIPALHANSLDFAKKWQSEGIRLLTFASEVNFMITAAQATAQALKQNFLSK